MKTLLPALFIGIALPTYANMANALLKGTKEVVKIVDSLPSPPIFNFKMTSLSNPWNANDFIRGHMNSVLDALRLPRNAKGWKLLQVIEGGLMDQPHLRELRGEVVAFLRSEPGDTADARTFYASLGGLARLISRSSYAQTSYRESFLSNVLPYRYGSRFRTAAHGGPLFAYPTRLYFIKEGFHEIEEFITLRRLPNHFAPLVDTVPRDRNALEDFLHNQLVGMGFDPVSPEDIYGISQEKLACWALMVRMSKSGNHPMRQLAQAVFEAIGAGESKDFFGGSNANWLYGLIFELDFTHGFFGERIETARWINNLREVAKARRLDPEYPLGEILRRQSWYTPPTLSAH